MVANANVPARRLLRLRVIKYFLGLEQIEVQLAPTRPKSLLFTRRRISDQLTLPPCLESETLPYTATMYSLQPMSESLPERLKPRQIAGF